jgi:signal transduction histidine kinase
MTEKHKENKFDSIRFSIKLKIFLASLLPIFALFISAFITQQSLTILGESAEQILSKNYKSIKAIQQVEKTLEENRSFFIEQLAKGDKRFGILPGTFDKMSAALKVCQENITEPEEKNIIDRLYSEYELFKKAALDSPPDNSSGGTMHLDIDRLPMLTTNIIMLINEFIIINEKAMELAEKNSKLLSKHTRIYSATIFIISIVSLLILNYFFAKRIALPIMKLTNILSTYNEYDTTYLDIHIKSRDEIGLLTSSFNQLFQRLEKYNHLRDDTLNAEKLKVRQFEENRAKFIADISHQLKTPMTSLAMGVNLLYDQKSAILSDTQLTLIKTAKDDCMRMTILINELIDLSRLETHTIPRPYEKLDILNLVNECAAMLLKTANDQEVNLCIEAEKKLPEARIDSLRFPWVITNLLGNAIRYTEKGGSIILKIEKKGSRLYFHCIDTGSGIDPEFIPYIFDRHMQFSERGKAGVIGLGLAIVKDVIEQHGGKVSVKSHLGRGTTFTFWIPCYLEEEFEKSTDH